MTYDEALAAYDGAVPETLRQEKMHGGLLRDGSSAYAVRLRDDAACAYARRCTDIMRSVQAWCCEMRCARAHYPEAITRRMLDFLGRSLRGARDAALASRDVASVRRQP